MFAGDLRPSLRRRVALALAVVFVLGYVILAAALNVITRLWWSFHWFRSTPGFTPGLFSGTAYTLPFTTSTQVVIVVLVLPALVLTAWALWIVAGWAAAPPVRDGADRAPAWPAEPRPAHPDGRRSWRPTEGASRRPR